MSRNHDDGNHAERTSAQAAQALGEHEAVAGNHRRIGDDDVGFVRIQQFPGFLAIDRQVNLAHADRLKQRHQQMPHISAVIDDEHADLSENGFCHASNFPNPPHAPPYESDACAPLPACVNLNGEVLIKRNRN